MGKKAVSIERWNLAQESEKEYWKQFNKKSLLKEWKNFYEKKAKILLEELQDFIKINKTTKILQIGPGPIDIINYFPSGKKYAIDPLTDFYKKRFEANYNSFEFKKATGENLPYPNKYFDIVILINVLDHMHLPEKSLEEIKRVLKDSGLFYLSCYTYQKKFICLAKIASFFNKLAGKHFNIHHPYMFTRRAIQELISGKFKVISEEYGRDIGIVKDFEDLKRKRKHDKNLRKRLLAIFGFYGIINYTCICKIK